MKIALLQGEAVPLDVEANLRAVKSSAAEAKAAGAELLLTPELWVSGYAPLELAAWLTPDRVAPIRPALAEIARDVGIAIAASFPLARSDDRFAIAAGMWDAAGDEVLAYEKVHLWADLEPKAFTAATEAPAVASWNGRIVAFQVCYDIEFPEPSRYLASRGVDLLLVPTAIDGHSDYVPHTLVRARAAENSMVVAYADHAAAPGEEHDPDAGFTGLSTVAGRDGVLLGQAGHGSALLIVELPPVTPVAQGSADYLNDRRPDVYASWS